MAWTYPAAAPTMRRRATLVVVGDPYEELAVRPGASPDELRRAYRRRARALHPDGLAGRTDAEVAAATEAMARLNRAWAEVSGRARERAAAGAGAAASTGGVGWGGWDAEEFGPEETAGAVAPVGRPAVFRSLRALPWLALAVIMILIFVATAYAYHPSPAPPHPDVVGECLDVAPPLDRFVSCGSPNAGRVVAEPTGGAPCPVGSRPQVVEGPVRFTVCLAPAS